MDSVNSFGGSQRLMALAHQLRFSPPSPLDDDFDDLGIKDSGGKVVSHVGFVDSAITIAQDPEKFKPRKAGVLVCLFEGDVGDLRVILTQRRRVRPPIRGSDTGLWLKRSWAITSSPSRLVLQRRPHSA